MKFKSSDMRVSIRLMNHAMPAKEEQPKTSSTLNMSRTEPTFICASMSVQVSSLSLLTLISHFTSFHPKNGRVESCHIWFRSLMIIVGRWWCNPIPRMVVSPVTITTKGSNGGDMRRDGVALTTALRLFLLSFR